MRHLILPSIGLALTAGLVHAQQVVVPNGTAWGTTYTQTGTSPWTNATTIWSSTIFHRQYLYEAGNFTNPGQGVGGPITITGVRFRPEDGQADVGGHTWPAVTVTLGMAPVGMTQATMSTTFSSNFSTTPGDVGTPEALVNVVDGPASGSVPNTYAINLALTTGQFTYNPASGQALVIDVNSTAAALATPTALTLISGYATTAVPTVYLARTLSTTTAGSLTGTTSTTVPSILIDFIGPGGKGTVIAARNENMGFGCGGSARSFYQFFDGGQTFDLQGKSILMVPDNTVAPNFYTVSVGATPVDLTANAVGGAVSQADDTVVTHSPGWTFAYPGGTTTNFRSSANGYTWVGGTTTTGDFSVTVPEFLGVGGSATTNTARFSPAWHDWNGLRNTTANPAAGMYHFTNTTGGPGFNVTYVTWLQMGEFNTLAGPAIASSNTFQAVFDQATMSVEFRYGAMSFQEGICVTGFSPGWNTVASVDSGSRDLSAQLTPFTTQAADGALSMLLTQNGIVGSGPQMPGRAYLTNTISLTASNIPLSDNFLGLFLSDFAINAPGIPVPPFLSAGCNFHLTTIDTSIWGAALLGGSTATSLSATVPPVPAFCGATLYSQFISFDGFLVGHSSNVVASTIGSN